MEDHKLEEALRLALYELLTAADDARSARLRPSTLARELRIHASSKLDSAVELLRQAKEKIAEEQEADDDRRR